MEPYAFIKNWYHNLSKQTKITFVFSWIFGMAAHIYVITNSVQNYDSVTWFPKGVGAGIKSGRWMLNIFKSLESIGGCYNLPVFNGLLTLLVLAISACIIVNIFRIKDMLHCVLLGGILICFPSVTSTMVFMYTAPYYAIAILLSVLAVWLYERWKFGFLGSIVCIACALGTYQAYLPLTASLFLVLLIYKCIDEELNWKKGIVLGIRYLVTMLLGVLLYYLVLQILLKCWNYSLTDYQGISDMGKISVSTLGESVKKTYYNCVGLIKQDYESLNNTVVIRCCILGMYLCSILLGVILVFGARRRFQERVIIILLVLIIPIAVDSIEILCPNSRIYTLMLYSMSSLYLLPILVIELFERKFENRMKIRTISKWIVSICMIVVIVSYTYSSNGAYMLMDYTESQTENHLSSLIDRIKNVPGYKDELPVVFVGDNIEDETIVNKWENSPFNYGGTATNLLNTYSRRSFMINILGYSYNKPTSNEKKKIMGNPKVWEMPVYPDDGSIEVIDDIVVVRLADAE